jgi:putative zinc ribbon protein
MVVRYGVEKDIEWEPAQDIAMICIGCSGGFLWTVPEQVFYRIKKFTPPKRCPGCRKSDRVVNKAESQAKRILQVLR